jgi:hypothetical protein
MLPQTALCGNKSKLESLLYIRAAFSFSELLVKNVTVEHNSARLAASGGVVTLF